MNIMWGEKLYHMSKYDELPTKDMIYNWYSLKLLMMLKVLCER